MKILTGPKAMKDLSSSKAYIAFLVGRPQQLMEVL